MFFRRIREHLRNDDWFAVAVDFLVVVGGVGIALWAESAIRAQSVEADIAVLEKTLAQERLAIYLNAAERLSLSQCRVQRMAELTDALIKSDGNWPGMPLEGPQSGALNTHIPLAWSEPIKRYPVYTWDAALTQGLVASMEQDRVAILSAFFAAVQALAEFQSASNELAMRVHSLSLKMELSPETRVDFLRMLSELDHNSAIAEIAAEQVKALAEAAGFDLTEQEVTLLKSQLDAMNSVAAQSVGDCFVPISTIFLE